jgi:class 3 adenylate cyclase
VLSSAAHRRLSPWLAERGLRPTEEQLSLKGFSGPQTIYRVLDPSRIAAAG